MNLGSQSSDQGRRTQNKVRWGWAVLNPAELCRCCWSHPGDPPEAFQPFLQVRAGEHFRGRRGSCELGCWHIQEHGRRRWNLGPNCGGGVWGKKRLTSSRLWGLHPFPVFPSLTHSSTTWCGHADSPYPIRWRLASLSVSLTVTLMLQSWCCLHPFKGYNSFTWKGFIGLTCLHLQKKPNQFPHHFLTINSFSPGSSWCQRNHRCPQEN